MEDETECAEARTGKTAQPLASAQSDAFASSDPAARHDGGGVIHTWNTDHTEDDAAQRGEEDELHSEEDEESYETNDDEDGVDTRDSEFDEEDDESSEFGDNEAAGKEDPAPVSSALDFLRFIGHPTRPRFTSVGNTAGFMRVTAAAKTDHQHSGEFSEIVVHYRCTNFSRGPLNTWHGHVSVRSRLMLHRVRFLLPSASLAADPARSLRLAGAALADMIYPVHSRDQLFDLWSSLVVAPPGIVVPPGTTTRVEVTVDVGILRPRDRTPEWVAYMLKALPSLARLADGVRRPSGCRRCGAAPPGAGGALRGR